MSLLLAMGCVVGPPEFDKDRGYEGDADTDTGTGTDTDTATDTDSGIDSGADSGLGDPLTFEDPSDWVDFSANQSPEQVSLEDKSGELNQGQQFYLVMLNGAESDQTFNLRFTPATEDSAGPPAPSAAAAKKPVAGDLIVPAVNTPRRDVLDSADIGMLEDVFRVRSHIEKSTEYEVKDGTLWALGDNVAIWVDNEVYIDWDYECDGVIDEAHQYETFGFDNCDLQTIADIIDLNIFPNVTGMFGDVSDIDGDGRVDVFITPELNQLPTTSSDEDDVDSVVPSYAEPSVDLRDYDVKTNPGSDQREVIYVYAPDPVGYFNSGATVSIDSYTNYSVAAEVARSLVNLISYYQHSEAGGTSVDEDWLNHVLGTMAADRCGFGAQFYADAWRYLDAPHLTSLVDADSKGSLAAEEVGAQFLFGVWFYHYVQTEADNPTALLANIVQTDTTGIESIEAALEADANLSDVDGQGPEGAVEFDDLVVHWQLSTLMSGVTKSDGNAMLRSDLVSYPDVETLSSPPAMRDSLYGANGYQRGVALNGTNYPYEGGHTDAPAVVADDAVTLGNTDVYHFDPAFDYEGVIAGGYGATVVRLDGIPYDYSTLEIQYPGDGFVGAVVRWEDPSTVDYTVENMIAPTDVQPLYLPSLPSDGTPIYGIGEITEATSVTYYGSDGDDADGTVVDTDRWLLDLRDRDVGTTVSVAIWLDRRFDDSGSPTPDDPWLAVAPYEWLPWPSPSDTRSDVTCVGAQDFEFPTSVLQYMYYQDFLSNSLGSEPSDFDACGVQETETLPTCAEDWDDDLVPDESEPAPTTFFEQVLVAQCSHYGGSLPGSIDAYSEDWIDWDATDDDDDFTFSMTYNVGGRSGDAGEEAFVWVDLEGGQQYVIVVGAETGEGLYEISLRSF
ncbi:MAG: hypothetical protein FJ090_19470 [Deltaproteobacteria bacterium]|nr:hypothetical protein [Deltaproteobacteria bacterium]